MTHDMELDQALRLIRAIKNICEDACLPDERVRFYILEAINENTDLENEDE